MLVNPVSITEARTGSGPGNELAGRPERGVIPRHARRGNLIRKGRSRGGQATIDRVDHLHFGGGHFGAGWHFGAHLFDLFDLFDLQDLFDLWDLSDLQDLPDLWLPDLCDLPLPDRHDRPEPERPLPLLQPPPQYIELGAIRSSRRSMTNREFLAIRTTPSNNFVWSHVPHHTDEGDARG